jgi:predicted site-specific integrase-resolvase
MIMQSCEFITIEEVAERLHVSRATLFNWMQRGIFTQGKHFFKHGRVLRFIWGDDLVTALMGESLVQAENKPVSTQVSKSAKSKKASPLNWDY